MSWEDESEGKRRMEGSGKEGVLSEGTGRNRSIRTEIPPPTWMELELITLCEIS